MIDAPSGCYQIRTVELLMAEMRSESDIPLSVPADYFWRSTLVGFCNSDDFVWISPYRARHRNEFSHVETSLAKLELRYERLASADALTQFSLRQARVLTSLHEQLDDAAIEV